ncbi:MAG: S41 family peptidase, partial [Oligoflexia bacterium]|nr:S41 family peptidase [Oligoflexia bacterium]
FGGLGLEVTQKDGVIYVVTPLDDTPAYRAGIKTGDKIVEIDHENTLGLTLDEAVKKMKGGSGEKVMLGIIREGNSGLKHFELTREKIKIRPIKAELIGGKYAFIRLTQFQKGAADAIRSQLKKMRTETKEVEGLILDLRSNPGGLLDEAVEVSSIFLKEGIVVHIEGRNGEKKNIRYVSQEEISNKELDLPIAILINGASASASEIVAGALQDHQRALIMGQQSFGKGSVQAVSQIDEDNGVKLTIAQYLTPKQRRIQALGIKPDIEIEEVDFDWNKENYKTRYIRELDLKNHLNATIETEAEKELRLRREKEERQRRVKEMEERRKGREKDTAKNSKNKRSNDSDDEETKELLKKYDPKIDFQVIQAINYLKSFRMFRPETSKTSMTSKKE